MEEIKKPSLADAESKGLDDIQTNVLVLRGHIKSRPTDPIRHAENGLEEIVPGRDETLMQFEKRLIAHQTSIAAARAITIH